MKHIEQHNADSRDRIMKSYSNTEDIRKGEIMDRLANGYGSGEALKFTKTGKEIKEKVPSIMEALNTAKTTTLTQLTILKAQIGCEPSDSFSSNLEKIGLEITLLRYPYAMCDSVKDPNSGTWVRDAKAEACSKYNDLCWQLIDIEKDIKALHIIKENVDDGKKYELTVSQLVALQFN